MDADLIETLRAARRALAWAAERHPELAANYDHLDAAMPAIEAQRREVERVKRDIADLYAAMPMLPITAETMDAATDWLTRYCIDFHREINAATDAAIGSGRRLRAEGHPAHAATPCRAAYRGARKPLCPRCFGRGVVAAKPGTSVAGGALSLQCAECNGLGRVDDAAHTLHHEGALDAPAVAKEAPHA